MESSHIGLTKWALAFRLFAASKKGVSAAQIARMLGVTYKTAWFVAHRVREAMAPSGGDIGGGGRVVEADETYFGHSSDTRTTRSDGTPLLKRAKPRSLAVVTLAERRGAVRSFAVKRADKRTVNQIVKENVARDTRLHTDDSRLYGETDTLVNKHETIRHASGEYVRGDVTTNSVEGYFSVFERGMIGIYQHCGERHLQRYLNEFDFRQTNRAAVGVNDDLRTERMIQGAENRRLLYAGLVGRE